MHVALPDSPLLDGVTVVDFTRYLPGPLCTLHLAWLGAQVVHVQRPPYGDPMRAVPPIDENAGMSIASASLERGKQIVMLDLTQPDDHRHAYELCTSADVVVEGFRPGVAAQYGLDAESLRSHHPTLVHCSISCYGQDGPWVTVAGHDANAEAISGLLMRTGPADRPILPPVQSADIASGMLATSAICAALVRRAATGAGASIDMSMAEAALALQTISLPAAADPGEQREQGLLTGALACYNLYACADDSWMSVAAMEPHFFARLITALNLPEDLITSQLDPAAQPRLKQLMSERFASRTGDEWDNHFASIDACVTRVATPDRVQEHPQFAARHALEPLGDGYVPASPYVIDGRRTSVPPTNHGAGHS